MQPAGSDRPDPNSSVLCLERPEGMCGPAACLPGTPPSCVQLARCRGCCFIPDSGWSTPSSSSLSTQNPQSIYWPCQLQPGPALCSCEL